MSNLSSYMPSQFDLSFVDAVEYLVKTKREHHKFRTAKELLNELGIAPQNYIGIRNKIRGVSKEKIPDCIHILTKKYGVSEEWLRFRRGNIMSIPLTKEAEKAMSYDAAIVRIKELEMQLAHQIELLNKTNEMLEESKKMIALQQRVLDELKK